MMFLSFSRRALTCLLLLVQAVTAFTTIPTAPSTTTISSLLNNQQQQQQQSSTQVTAARYENIRLTLSTSRLWATWSDSRAVRDYQDFLNSGRQTVERAADQPSVILHNSNAFPETEPLVKCLQEMGMGEDVVVVLPGQELPAEIAGHSEYPIYITLPPYELEDFLANLPESYKERIDDFCFFSGGLVYGNIEDVLRERGYARDSMTQCLIGGLEIAAHNGRPTDCAVNLGPDAMGESKMAGECSATGKWAGAFAERLERSQVQCQVDFYREWRRRMWERSFYDAVFPLLGAVRDQPTTVAEVANYYGEEVADMCWELTQRLRGWRAVTLLYGFEERLLGFAEMRGTKQPCEVTFVDNDKMYPYIWGMNVFLESKMVADYLAYAQSEKGYLTSIELPRKSDADFTSHMRKGNLRADGVI